MSTIAELIADVRNYLGDDDTNKQYSDRMFLRVLNSFGSEIRAIGKDWSINDGFITVQGTYNYEFPEGMWFPINAKYQDTNGEQYPLTILDPSNFSDLDYRSGKDTGRPMFLSIKNREFVIYPTPDNNYEITFEVISDWVDIAVADLGDDFSLWFDKNYEKYAFNYLIMTLLKPTSDVSLALKNSITFTYYRSNGDWETIKKLELLKYKPLNAKSRRYLGVQKKTNYSDYNASNY